MVRRTRYIAPLVLVAAAVALVPGQARAQAEVKVVNTPLEVAATQPIPHATLQRIVNVPVSAGSSGISGATPAGYVEATGYTRMMLSLGGEIQGSDLAGTVSAVLVPTEEFVQKSLDKATLFAVRAEANEITGTGLFAAEPYSVPVSFPRYAVYLFNNGERSVKANLYVYLTQ